MGRRGPKLQLRLVERCRQKRFWDSGAVCPVPYYAAPTVRGTYIAVALRCQSPEETLLYCLRSDFDYAKAWEFKIPTPIVLISSPQWWGTKRIAVTALLADGKYQGIVANLETQQFASHTLMKGESYSPFRITEDRYPVSPIVAGSDLFLISPHGHVASVNSGQRRSLGQNLRIYFDPVVSGQNVIFNVGNDKQTWLECRKVNNMQKVYSTKKYKALRSIVAGPIGSSPIVRDQGIICGLGDCLVCFTHDGRVVWEFAYPHIESLDEKDQLQVLSNDKVIYQSTSEVNISSNLYGYRTYLYFVLSDYVSHNSYLTKLNITAGKVVWASKIAQFNGNSRIVDVSSEGILLQNGVFLWVFAHDGIIISREVKLDIDCASCSNLVRVTKDRYVLLADLGVYEAKVELPKPELVPFEEKYRNLTCVEFKSGPYLSVASLILKEEQKTRKCITKKMTKIEKRLDSINITLLGVKEEITIKRAAYGEFEIVLPVALGTYKIHVPAGEINSQDIVRIRAEISNVFTQALEKAKRKSIELYTELKNRKGEMTQRIVTELKKLEGRE